MTLRAASGRRGLDVLEKQDRALSNGLAGLQCSQDLTRVAWKISSESLAVLTHQVPVVARVRKHQEHMFGGRIILPFELDPSLKGLDIAWMCLGLDRVALRPEQQSAIPRPPIPRGGKRYFEAAQDGWMKAVQEPIDESSVGDVTDGRASRIHLHAEVQTEDGTQDVELVKRRIRRLRPLQSTDLRP